MITENLKKMKKTDLYSLVLFALYKMRDIPDYRVLSELVYILDRDSLLRLCEYFGGNEIRIPTLDDLEITLYCLLVYESVQSGKSFETAIGELNLNNKTQKDVRDTYSDLADVLREYNFVPRDDI